MLWFRLRHKKNTCFQVRKPKCFRIKCRIWSPETQLEMPEVSWKDLVFDAPEPKMGRLTSRSLENTVLCHRRSGWTLPTGLFTNIQWRRLPTFLNADLKCGHWIVSLVASNSAPPIPSSSEREHVVINYQHLYHVGRPIPALRDTNCTLWLFCVMICTF